MPVPRSMERRNDANKRQLYFLTDGLVRSWCGSCCLRGTSWGSEPRWRAAVYRAHPGGRSQGGELLSTRNTSWVSERRWGAAVYEEHILGLGATVGSCCQRGTYPGPWVSEPRWEAAVNEEHILGLCCSQTIYKQSRSPDGRLI